MAGAVFSLPPAMVMKPYKQVQGYNVYYKKKEDGSEGGGVALGSETEFNVFNPLVKIEAERAKIDNKYVNIRFSCSNRYWERVAGSDNIAAPSTIPKEDTTQYDCTLFQPYPMSNPSNGFYLKHVNSGKTLAINGNNAFTLVNATAPNDSNYLTFVDCETLLQLPQHVTFKGDNGMYLKAFNFNQGVQWYKHLQYGETDANKLLSGHTVHQEPDGHVRILSDYSGEYWERSGSNWILTNSKVDYAAFLFWPIKIDGNTIALRCKGNGKFCQRLTDDTGRKDFLSGTADTITAEAKMEVEELVLDRKIYYVDYKMEDALIVDEQPYLAGSSLVINATDSENSQSVTITYQDEKSYTFSRGVSIAAGVSIEIKAGIPFIVQEKIAISLEVNGSFEWDTTTTTTTSVSATGTVVVPPKSSVVVEYVGTKGTCNIPYSYTQLDKSSTDGQIKRTDMNDGTYTGVSCYNFSFQMSAPKAML